MQVIMENSIYMLTAISPIVHSITEYTVWKKSENILTTEINVTWCMEGE